MSELHSYQAILESGKQLFTDVARKLVPGTQPESLLLRLPFTTKLRYYVRLSSQKARALADPFSDTIPSFITKRGAQFITEDHQRHTQPLSFHNKDPYAELLARASHDLHWYGIRARAFVAAGRHHLPEAVERHLTRSSRNYVHVHVLSPAPVKRVPDNAYARNIHAETRFLLRHADHGEWAVKLGVTSNMLIPELSEAIASGAFRLEVDPSDDTLVQIVTAYDGLSRLLYAIGELSALRRIAVANGDRLSLEFLNNEADYRGFLSSGQNSVATVQVSMKNRPGLMYSELQTKERSYKILLEDAARECSAGARRFDGARGIEQAYDELRDCIRSHSTDLDLQEYPDRSNRESFLKVLSTCWQGKGVFPTNFDEWFDKKVKRKLWDGLKQDLITNELVNVASPLAP